MVHFAPSPIFHMILFSLENVEHSQKQDFFAIHSQPLSKLEASRNGTYIRVPLRLLRSYCCACFIDLPTSIMTKNPGDDDPTAATTVFESVGDEYLLATDDDVAYIASADTFSMGAEAISVYGADGKCEPWNLSRSGRFITSRIFKV